MPGQMGTGSDTRMYNPRSESSHLYSVEDERGEYKHGIGDDKDMEERRDKAQIQQEAEKVKDLPHLKIDIEHANPPPDEMPPEMPPGEGEEPQMDDDENAVGAEVSQMTGMPGSSGHQLDEAVGARTGTGSAIGGYRPLLATGEPMEDAWSSLLKYEGVKFGHKGKRNPTPWTQPEYDSFPRVRQPGSENKARAKTIARVLSRYSSGGGLDRAHNTLERSHLGTGHPLRLDPSGKYQHYQGVQASRRARGGIPFSVGGQHGLSGERSAPAGPTGAGRIRQLSSERRSPGTMTGHTPNMPGVSHGPKMSPNMFKADLEKIQGLLLKAKSPVDYLHFSQLRSMLRDLKKVMEAKESRLKSTPNFQGGPGEVGHRDGGTTNPQGGTDNIEAEERKGEGSAYCLVSRGSGRSA